MTTTYQPNFITVDFSTSSLISDSFQITSQIPTYVQFPSAWDSTAVQFNNITFQGSVDGSTFVDLYKANGNEITIVGAQGKAIPLDPLIFINMNFLQIRSGLGSSGVFQTSPRTVSIGLGRFLSN